MKYLVLASGSKGNSTIVYDEESYILIDIGISIKEFEQKISNENIDIKDINKILITHEHSDHTKSISFFDFNNVYSGEGTLSLRKENILNAYEKINLNGFDITPLPLSHDAINCFGFLVEKNNQKLVYIADTGYVNNKLYKYIDNADYYIFESNHDVKMLINSKRPLYLKDRILSDYGHLSNDMASEELCAIIGENTKEIIFAHVSQDVNEEKKVLQTFYRIANENNIDISKIRVLVASQKDVVKGGS